MNKKAATDESLIESFAQKKWGPVDRAGTALKLGEEVGEVLGAVVKIPEGRASLDDLRDELGDVLVVVARLAAQLDTTLDDLLRRRIQNRHPDLKLWKDISSGMLSLYTEGVVQNAFIKYHHEDLMLDHMRDPFLFLECKTCGVVEGLPIDQSRKDFGCFDVSFNTRAPGGAFFTCCNCEDAPHKVHIDIDEGTEDDGDE